MKKCISFSLIAFVILVMGWKPLMAADTVFNVTSEGVAIGGYDPVAYVVDRSPTRGDSGLSFNWSGAVWHFSSVENLEVFRNDPERYAPAYGGWCAMGMAGGKVVEVDFERGWALRDGKLYLNVDKDINVRWQRAAQRMITRADKEWLTVQQAILDGRADIFRKDLLPGLYQ